MMNVSTLKLFLSKFGKNLDAGISIIDNKGYIIASTRAGLEGRLVPAACAMLKSGAETRDIYEAEAEGDAPGIYFVIRQYDQPMGIAVLEGAPDMIRSSVGVLKAALETMLENEEAKYQVYCTQYKDAFEQLKYCLLNSDNASSFELKSLFARYGYDDKALRCAIVVSFNNAETAERMLARLGEEKMYNNQDIAFVSREGCIVLFKTFAAECNDNIALFKHELEDFSAQLCNSLAGCDDFHIYVGSIQRNPLYLRTSYLHCLWLRNTQQSADNPIFFYHRLKEYFGDFIPMLELHKVFAVFDFCMDKDFGDMLIDVTKALDRSCYNLKAGSQDLFVHKNTLAIWVKHINSRFGTDFIHNFWERDFMQMLNSYLERSRINRN